MLKQPHPSSKYSSLSPPPDHLLGTILLDRIQLVSVLGVGAYGVVYLAVDIQTGLSYAVKSLSRRPSPTSSSPPEVQKQFRDREIALHLLASSHPNVVRLMRVLDSDEFDCHFLIMEYCPDNDLFNNITEKNKFVGDDFLARHAFLQVLDAVQFCHEQLGIYHRDLKPENILIADGGMTLKLADFGLATNDTVSEDYGCGSTFYMSPGMLVVICSLQCVASSLSLIFIFTECLSSIPYATGPNDVWSLGVILVNLTSGRNPWKKASLDDPTFRSYVNDSHVLKRILPSLSDDLHSIIRRIFCIDPTKRITLPELRDAILACPTLTVPVTNTVPPALAPPPQLVTTPASPQFQAPTVDTSMHAPPPPPTPSQADSALAFTPGQQQFYSDCAYIPQYQLAPTPLSFDAYTPYTSYPSSPVNNAYTPFSDFSLSPALPATPAHAADPSAEEIPQLQLTSPSASPHPQPQVTDTMNTKYLFNMPKNLAQPMWSTLMSSILPTSAAGGTADSYGQYGENGSTWQQDHMVIPFY